MREFITTMPIGAIPAQSRITCHHLDGDLDWRFKTGAIIEDTPDPASLTPEQIESRQALDDAFAAAKQAKRAATQAEADAVAARQAAVTSEAEARAALERWDCAQRR